MSMGNIASELRHGTAFPTPSTTPVYVINVDHATYGKACIFGYVGGAPGTYCTTAGKWNIGGICIDTTNGKPYSNQASITTTPTWVVLS